MSDIISFKYSGEKDQYNRFKASNMSKGKTMEETFSKFIDQELTIIDHLENDDNKTASKHEDELKERLMNSDLSKVLVTGSFHVDIESLEFIQAVSHDLARRVTGAVHSAVASYWVHKWATSKVNSMQKDILSILIENIADSAEKSKSTIIKQEITKYHLSDLSKFYEAVDKVKVTFSCNIPIITLSDLREKDLTSVIQFDCIIIGTTPKKLNLDTGKYIQDI